MKREKYRVHFIEPCEIIPIVSPSKPIKPPETKKGPSNESIERYVHLLQNSRPKRSQQIKTRQIAAAEVPLSLENPWTKILSPRGPPQITKAFNKSPRFKNTQPGLSVNLPNLLVTRRFRQYIEKNGERIPVILKQATENI